MSALRELVLLVDDDALSRGFIAEALRKAGAGVVEAEDGIEAIALLPTRPFDCVLTGLRLPRGGGLEVLAESKRLDPDRPVVVLTGFRTAGCALDALHRGAADVFEKPLRAEDLELVFARLRERIRLLRENRALRARIERRSEAGTSEVRAGRSLRSVERELIVATLDACGGNRTRAARMLGIGVRTLFNKIKAFEADAPVESS